MNAYWLFTPEQLEAALDEHLHAKQLAGAALDDITAIGSEIREFLARSEAALKHGLRIEQQHTESVTRGPGVTG